MEAVIGIGSFVSMMLLSMLACAALFQFPVIMMILFAIGIVDSAWLKKQRAAVLVAILIIAALVTPPDIVSQLMAAVPTSLLFELTLFSVHLTERKEKKKS